MITFETAKTTRTKDRPARIRTIALVHKHVNAGGIEAVIVRMARWLTTNGYSVTIYLYSNGGTMLRYLQQINGLTIVVRDNGKEPPIDLSVFNRLMRAEKFDLVYSFSPAGFLLSHVIPAHVRLSGVYQPETYKLERNRKLIRAIRAFDRNFHQRLVFMNPTVRRYTARALGIEMPEQFMPAPIEPCGNDRQLGDPHSRRIVSVGAIQQFSTHYAQVIELMEELIQIDPDFTYHIYGEGPDEARLRKRIAESDAKGHIFLHPIPKGRAKADVLRDSFCFIGSGAVMIQACGSGIPGITSRINDADALSEGYFHHLPPYEIGESFWEASETYEIGELVKNLLVSENIYRKIAEQCRQKALKFEIDNVMADFLKLAEGKLSKRTSF